MKSHRLIEAPGTPIRTPGPPGKRRLGSPPKRLGPVRGPHPGAGGLGLRRGSATRVPRARRHAPRESRRSGRRRLLPGNRAPGRRLPPTRRLPGLSAWMAATSVRSCASPQRISSICPYYAPVGPARGGREDGRGCRGRRGGRRSGADRGRHWRRGGGGCKWRGRGAGGGHWRRGGGGAANGASAERGGHWRRGGGGCK